MRKILTSIVATGVSVLAFGGVALASPAVPSQCSGQTVSQTFSAGRQIATVTNDNEVVFVPSSANEITVTGNNDCIALSGSRNIITANNAAGNDVTVDTGSSNVINTNGTVVENGSRAVINGVAYVAPTTPPVVPLVTPLAKTAPVKPVVKTPAHKFAF